MLPPGPQWKCKPWNTPHATKKPVKLYFRDPIECVESLFNNPLLADAIKLVPFRQFKTAEKLVRVFSEWMSGNVAWDMQVSRRLLRYRVQDINSQLIRASCLLVRLSSALYYLQIKRLFPL